MSLREALFSGGDARLLERLRPALGTAFGVREEPAEKIRRSFHDTFDWRILHAGGALIEDERRRPSSLCWIASDGELLHGPIEAGKFSFAEDLPPGPFRDALRQAAGVRRIERKLRLRADSWRLTLTDDRGKGVVRLALLAGSVRELARGGGTASIDALLHVRSVRGYEAHFERALLLLEEATGELLREQHELSSLLRRLEIDPERTRSRFRMRLDTTMPAEVGVRRILLELARTMELNTEGTRRNLDSEYLHDFRVALRRTRSCLGQLRGALDARSLAPFVETFRDLGRITGIVRDLDVHLLHLPAYRAGLAAEERPALEPLEAWLTEKHRREQRRLARALASKLQLESMERWVAFLETEQAGSSKAGPDGDRPLGELARERLRIAYERIVRRGSKLHAATPAAKIHRLRIDCKKLRYLLEFFHSLFDESQLDGAVGELKRLQDALGEFNDLDVQSASLRRIAQELIDAGECAAPTPIALGRLIERAEQRQRKLRARISERLQAFIGDEVRAKFLETMR